MTDGILVTCQRLWTFAVFRYQRTTFEDEGQTVILPPGIRFGLYPHFWPRVPKTLGPCNEERDGGACHVSEGSQPRDWSWRFRSHPPDLQGGEETGGGTDSFSSGQCFTPSGLRLEASTKTAKDGLCGAPRLPAWSRCGSGAPPGRAQKPGALPPTSRPLGCSSRSFTVPFQGKPKRE